MCGIAGIIGYKQKFLPQLLRKMTDAIAHRGPDGDGHWVNQSGNVGLGHRRLAIIDLSRDGNQPMHYLDRYTIIFNGEIYNYVEIKERLVKKGYVFKSSSDTEVLLALFDEKKEKCLDDLDGMFAFAIWDEKEQRLFCARDRFGEKPFFYAVYKNSLYFASEMKALWAAGVPRERNNRMLFNYLINGMIQNPHDLSETFYQGIYKLKFSHYFYVSADNLNPEQIRYWDIDYSKPSINISEDDAAEEFRSLFFESIGRRLRSDVAVGSSLSGGLDSSAVICVIDRLRQNRSLPQATFSARFPGFAKDEGEFMTAVINQINVEPHYVFPDETGLIKDFDTLCRYQEEPFGSASIYAQFCVMRLAKENNVTVLLDGQGADEMLAGYLTYFEYYFKQLKKSDKNLYISEKKSHESIHGTASKNFLHTGTELINDYAPRKVKENLRKLKKLLNAESGSFLSKDFFRAYGADDFSLNYDYPQTLSRALYNSIAHTGLEDLLRYADRNSMAHSREVRLPFLSHTLVEFVFSLPDNFKLRNGITKFIMRRAFDSILPEKILKRTDKIGYEPPQNKWMETGKVADKIRAANANLINEKILQKNFDTVNKDKSAIWRILMADSFYRI